MTPHANARRSRAEFRVGGVTDRVIAVTHDASGKAGGLEGGLVRALVVHLILKHMAFRTDVLHRIHARWRCTVGSMAGRARRRA